MTLREEKWRKKKLDVPNLQVRKMMKNEPVSATWKRENVGILKLPNHSVSKKRLHSIYRHILLLCFLILGGHSDPHKPMFFLYFDHRFFPAHKLMHHNLDSMQYQNSEQATSKVYHINLFQYMLISPMKIAFNLCMDIEYLPKHNKK